MGLFSNLTSIAGLVAAPFTGGASLGLTALGGLGSAATGAAKGAEADRASQANYGIQRDQLGLNAAATNEQALQQREQLELQRRKQALESGTSAFQNALRAATVSGFKPAARPRGVSNISFVGNAPTLARPAAQAMDREAMLRLLEGEKYAPMADYKPYQLSSPEEMKKASTLEKIMGIVGLGASGAANIWDKQNQQQQQR